MQENSIATVTASATTPDSEVGGRNGVPHTSTPVTNTVTSNDIDQAQFEADKRAVYK